jgi:IS5 family transposase
MSRLLIPQLSFVDLQLQHLGIHLDPSLQRIADFLKQHADLVEFVRKDLERGLKKPGAGRHGITPEQTLRSLILMRVKNLDYRDLRDRVNDGFTLRSFTQFDSHSVPKHDAFNRAFNRLTPATLAAINHLVVQAAVELDLEDGKQLRVDTTSITRPMPPYCGIPFAPSRVWSTI